MKVSPDAVGDLLLQYRKNLVFLDIDTEIWRMPELLFGEHDFAIYNWFADKNHHLEGKLPYNPNSKKLLCSGGVMKFAYTAPSINLLINWIRLLPQNPKMIDDQVLDLAFNNKLVKDEINLIAAHLHAQISLLRHQSMEYNVDATKVLFLALNRIHLAFAKYRKE